MLLAVKKTYFFTGIVSTKCFPAELVLRELLQSPVVNPQHHQNPHLFVGHFMDNAAHIISDMENYFDIRICVARDLDLGFLQLLG